MIRTILGLVGWVFVGFGMVFGVAYLWYWIKDLLIKMRGRKLANEVESELRKAYVRKILNEDMETKGEGWILEEMWYGENPPFEPDDREWWLRDQDNPGDR